MPDELVNSVSSDSARRPVSPIATDCIVLEWPSTAAA